MEKSWNFISGCLWEPCITEVHDPTYTYIIFAPIFAPTWYMAYRSHGMYRVEIGNLHFVFADLAVDPEWKTP